MIYYNGENKKNWMEIISRVQYLINGGNKMKNVVKSVIKNVNFRREVRAYNKYLTLNVARKAAEGGGNKLFTALDNVRRQCGFVK